MKQVSNLSGFNSNYLLSLAAMKLVDEEGSGDQETGPIITVVISAVPPTSAAPTIAAVPTTAGQSNNDNVDTNEGSGRDNLDLEPENEKKIV